MLDCDFQICRSGVDLRELRDSVGRLLLESDVRVGDNQRAQDGVHDGVEGASGEGSEGERDQADADQSEIDVSRGFSLRMPGAIGRSCIHIVVRGREHKPLKRPVVAALRGVGFGNGSRVVHYQDRLISKTSARVVLRFDGKHCLSAESNGDCISSHIAGGFVLNAIEKRGQGRNRKGAEITYWFPGQSLYRENHVSNSS